jgi:hypothetical protein
MTDTEVKALLESEKFIFDIDGEDDRELKEEELEILISKTLAKYDLAINTGDFDYNRIYKKGYQEIEDWDDYYVTSFSFVTNDDETKLYVEVC